MHTPSVKFNRVQFSSLVYRLYGAQDYDLLIMSLVLQLTRKVLSPLSIKFIEVILKAILLNSVKISFLGIFLYPHTFPQP